MGPLPVIEEEKPAKTLKKEPRVSSKSKKEVSAPPAPKSVSIKSKEVSAHVPKSVSVRKTPAIKNPQVDKRLVKFEEQKLAKVLKTKPDSKKEDVIVKIHKKWATMTEEERDRYL
jgi:hypothetical protein